jgi:hypothetical protein
MNCEGQIGVGCETLFKLIPTIFFVLSCNFSVTVVDDAVVRSLALQILLEINISRSLLLNI